MVMGRTAYVWIIFFCVGVPSYAGISDWFAGFTWKVDPVKKYERHPRVRALLDTIAFAEGTDNPEGYRTIFSYKYFDDFSDHPRQVHCVEYQGKELCSSAAGRYQFLRKTWDRVRDTLNLPDFSPKNQDRAAIYLMYEKDALEPLLRPEYDLSEVFARINTEWASIPGAPYGQKVRDAAELERVFKDRLQWHEYVRRA